MGMNADIDNVVVDRKRQFHKACGDYRLIAFGPKKWTFGWTVPILRMLLFYFQKPIGVLTTTAGRPVDLREVITVNSDIINNEFLLDTMLHFNRERIPERVVHAKGTAALGYFIVTHDISKYTKADVFNGIGKKTPVIGRFSTAIQGSGGPDVAKELKGLGVKFITKEGNLDLLCLNAPVYLYRDPLYFNSQFHAFKRNPRTNVFDPTMTWEFVTNRPETLHAFFYLNSDLGIPKSYRHMDIFPIHTYELNNKNGDRYFVRFNFRTDQGIKNLTSAQLLNATIDLDFYTRDLYNAIYRNKYPSWTLELDIMAFDDIIHLDYNPFDVSRLWKKGTYHTVEVGQLVFDKNPNNMFKVAEVSAFNPGSLVPGIPGPVDILFKGRRLFYRDTQNYRLGVNHNNVEVNKPLYAKTYTRDGVVPVGDNMRDAPNIYPNSYNGPEPIVDDSLPSKKILILESSAVDLEPVADFYNRVLTDEGQRQRLVDTLSETLATVVLDIQKKALKLLTLIDKDLGRRVRATMKGVIANNIALQHQADKDD